MSEELKGHLDLLLLTILRNGRSHGYAVIEQLRQFSDGEFDLPEGTVYPALHRLESQGYLTATWAVHDGRRRKTYELTASGEAVRLGRNESWLTFAGAVARVINGAAPGAGTARAVVT